MTFCSVSCTTCDPIPGLSGTTVIVKPPFMVFPLRVVLQFESVPLALCGTPLTMTVLRPTPLSDKVPPLLTDPEAGTTNETTSTLPWTSVPDCVSVTLSPPDAGTTSQPAPEQDARCQLPCHTP